MNLEDAEQQEANVTQETYNLCMDKLKEVYKIAVIMDYPTQFTELENSLPALAVGVSRGQNVPQQIVIITFLPLELYNLSTSFHMIAQFTIIALENIPDDKLDDLKRLLDFYNSTFSLGTYILLRNSLTEKYAMYIDHESELDQVVFAKTMEMLAVEANDIALEAQEIIDGEKTVEEIIDIALERNVNPVSDDAEDKK